MSYFRLPIAIAALCFACVATPTEAGTLAPKKASQTVLLIPSGAACGSGRVFDIRQAADGTFTPGFTIPAGEVLMLDFLSWTATSANPGIRQVGLEIDGSTSIWVEVAGDATTTAAGKAAPLPLIPVRSGHTVCISASFGDTIVIAQLHGFLVKDS